MSYSKKPKLEGIVVEINTLRLIALSIMAGVLYMGFSQSDDLYVIETMPFRIGLASLFLIGFLATFFSEKAKKNFSSILFGLGFPLILSFVIHVYHYRFEPTRAFGILIMIATYGFIFNSKKLLIFNLVFHTVLLLYFFYQTKLPLVDAHVYIPMVLFTFSIFYFLTSSKIDNINAISEKKAILSALFYNSPEAYLLYDHSTGLVSACNSSMIHLLGANSSGQISQKSASELQFMEPVLKKMPEIIDHLNRYSKTWNEEVTLNTFKTYPIISDLAINRLEADSNLLTMRFVDITHRRAVEDALQMMRFSVDQASEMVFWLDEKGKIVYANGAAHRLLQYADNELLNKNIESIDTTYAQALQQENPKNGHQSGMYDRIGAEAVYISRMGDEIPVDIGKNLLQYADKKIICLFARDISARKNAETALRSYAEKLKSSNDELEQFAYVVSHDMQAPLRMVASYLQLLERKLTKQGIDDTDKEYIRFAIEGSQRMGEMIQAILQYSRINRLTLNLEKFNVNEILNVSLNNLSILIAEAKADIQFTQMPTIWADKFKLTQLFQNLIGNALKYRKDNTKTVVKILYTETPETWEFSVSDNGIGIAEEYHEKIFKMFQRAHSYNEYEGTGIGLSICQSIVQQHGGQVWLDSVLDKGTTFYFSISKKLKT